MKSSSFSKLWYSVIFSYSKIWGGSPSYHPPPPPPHDKGGGGWMQTYQKVRKKRRVGNLHGHLRTRLGSAVTSATSPLEIEGFRDKDGQTGPTGQSINFEGEKGVKEEGTAPAAHTTAPARSDCPAVNTWCECGPTLACKTARCDFHKAACTCVSFQCLGQCAYIAPQTRKDKQRKTQGGHIEEQKRRHGRTKGGKTRMHAEVEGKENGPGGDKLTRPQRTATSGAEQW